MSEQEAAGRHSVTTFTSQPTNWLLHPPPFIPGFKQKTHDLFVFDTTGLLTVAVTQKHKRGLRMRHPNPNKSLVVSRINTFSPVFPALTHTATIAGHRLSVSIVMPQWADFSTMQMTDPV